MGFTFSKFTTVSLHKVSEVKNLITLLKLLPADILHCFNFVTMSFKMKYLKLIIVVVPAYCNVKKPIIMTSGCFSQKKLRKIGLYLQLIPLIPEMSPCFMMNT